MTFDELDELRETAERPKFTHYVDFTQCTEKTFTQSVNVVCANTGRVLLTKEMSIRQTPHGFVTYIDDIPKAVIDGEVMWTDEDNELLDLQPRPTLDSLEITS